MLKQSFFTQRRQALAQQLANNSAAIVFSAQEKTRSNDTEYHFRQDSTFYYFTGFTEPEAVLVMVKRDEQLQSVLFNREKDELQEIWHGRRLGQAAALEQFDIDQALSVEELSEKLPELVAGCDTIYHDFFDDNDSFIDDLLDSLKANPEYQAPQNLSDLRVISDEMRLVKQPQELEVMREAAKISSAAHTRAMQQCKAGMFEYQLEAEILHHFAMNGARFAAYNTIVGGGENACILHYTENESVLNDNELVLIDAGCELHGYAADITRTFPVNGKFTLEQKAIYELVLKAQIEAIKLLVPGNTIKMANDVAIEIMIKGLMELGILNGDVKKLIEEDAHRAFYMHGLSHWLGLDVHDVGDYGGKGRTRVLEPGMTLTVEPGLYFAAKPEINAKWHNIGVRIEDDILITKDGNEVLTKDVVKTVDEIEALMASS
ncbi:Xaa-Pro aminopeptidase [Psychrobium sp. MM17-31]|uniref:Xaa-Pro aminopeptidase n=1 Tax=Psychrobium sp. MM17-31 TaxID=2917758 RepID=UPI001EF3E09B|nr:Xaa-Pro aminopeptidase [Psychrobium sp. MM17-31]MCG7530422.1 Xaa-Pro aminopeptidase [Psychrobium sp. MM17-31]